MGAMFCASVVYPSIPKASTSTTSAITMPRGSRNCLATIACISRCTAVLRPQAPLRPPFLAAAYFWVSSAEAFGATLAESGTEIYADIPNFSRTQPDRGWAEVASATPSAARPPD